MEDPSLVVLAAGMGSRYGGLKQIDPMGPHGEPILDFSIYDAMRAGFSKVVFVIRRDFEEAFRAAAGNKFEARLQVEYAYQELTDVPPGFQVFADRERPWGTGHAVWAARHVVKEPFAVINADDFYGRDGYVQLATFLNAEPSDGCRLAMVGFKLRNTLSEHGAVARGICTADAAGCLQTIQETTGIVRTENGAEFVDESGESRLLTGEEITSLNMWGFAPDIFGEIESSFARFLESRGNDPKAEFYIPSVVGELVAGGKEKVKILPTTGTWFGVTFQDDKPRVMRSIADLMAADEYPERMWESAAEQDDS